MKQKTKKLNAVQHSHQQMVVLHTATLRLMDVIPILDRRPWVFAAANTNHDDGEEEEEAGHGETHAVHRLVAHNDVTVDFILNARYGGTSYTESRNLGENKEID